MAANYIMTPVTGTGSGYELKNTVLRGIADRLLGLSGTLAVTQISDSGMSTVTTRTIRLQIGDSQHYLSLSSSSSDSLTIKLRNIANSADHNMNDGNSGVTFTITGSVIPLIIYGPGIIALGGESVAILAFITGSDSHTIIVSEQYSTPYNSDAKYTLALTSLTSNFLTETTGKTIMIPVKFVTGGVILANNPNDHCYQMGYYTGYAAGDARLFQDDTGEYWLMSNGTYMTTVFIAVT